MTDATVSEPSRPAGLGVLYFIVCAAGPAPNAARGVRLALAAGWEVWVVPTPTGMDFVDADELAALTRHPVRARWRRL